jgi:aminoglycoside phosphotransferase family enzyme/predicted kinase
MSTRFAAQSDSSSGELVEPALLRALAASSMYPGEPHVEVHETHASWVFVAGEHAYKIKKPVALAFLDYGTLDRRRSACREEVRVNQALAPDLYLGVRAIVRSGQGFRFADDENDPGAVEYAVEMRSFREQDSFAGLIAAGSLTRAQVAAAAGLLADFHRAADVVDDWTPERVLARWRENVQELGQLEHPAGWSLELVVDFAEAFVRAHAQDLGRRALLGLVRDGHGDLRCEHVLAGPELRVVDRIEFDPQLRRVDVAADLAFLAMDMEARGARWAARELYDAYRHAGMSPGSEALRSFYAAHCALVRAKVALIAASERRGDERAEQLLAAERLWALGERLCWRARAPLAVVVCGPAASGKSVLAAELSRGSEMPVVASDAVRKRLAHLGAFEPARAEHYSAPFTRATYEQLGRDALAALESGTGVIVDATCRSRADRGLLLARLRAVDAHVVAVRCEVPLELIRRRAARRLQDPQRISDATPQIAEEQYRSFEELDELPEDSVLRLDTSRPVDIQVVDVARAVDRSFARA